jgi:hypothetical protein
MFNIDIFLKKFRKLTPPDSYIREIISSVIFNNLKIKINIKKIAIKNNIIYIKEKPVIKNEIFIHKKTILKEIKKKLKNKTFNNIL